MKLTRMIALFLAIVLFLPSYTGCAKAPPEPLTYDELSATNTLLLYVLKEQEAIFRSIATRFTASTGIKPELLIVDGGLDAYQERIAADLAAGSGPDVLFLYYLDSLDVAKSAQNYNFLDLTEILATDPEFSEEVFVDGVFDAGKFNGRQYTVPQSFYLPFYLSSGTKLDILEEHGFDWEEIRTTSEFMEEMGRLTPLVEELPSFLRMMQAKNFASRFFQNSGIRLLDYDNGEVLPDEALLRVFMEGYKAYYPYDNDGTGESWWESRGAQYLLHGSYYFFSTNWSQELNKDIDDLIAASHGYELHNMPSQVGDFVGRITGQMAINAATQNTLNAYKFIQYMLSEEEQSSGSALIKPVPVRKDSIRAIAHGEYTKMAISISAPGHKSEYLTEEEMDKIAELLMSADRYMQDDTRAALDMMWVAMDPFLRDEKSYEDCLVELKSKLTFYLSE